MKVNFASVHIHSHLNHITSLCLCSVTSHLKPHLLKVWSCQTLTQRCFSCSLLSASCCCWYFLFNTRPFRRQRKCNLNLFIYIFPVATHFCWSIWEALSLSLLSLTAASLASLSFLSLSSFWRSSSALRRSSCRRLSSSFWKGQTDQRGQL